jgi:hypothetical protein
MEYLFESSARRTWREVSFTGDSGGYIKEGSGNGCLSIVAPLGNCGEYAPLAVNLSER